MNSSSSNSSRVSRMLIVCQLLETEINLLYIYIYTVFALVISAPRVLRTLIFKNIILDFFAPLISRTIVLFIYQ
jgi:hypothetical protein